MPGEMSLEKLLEDLTVSRRPGTFVVVGVDEPVALGDGIEAILAEAEGTTVVATAAVADQRGWSYEFEAAWLTLDVHSALEAVGLTAAVSAALTAEDIPCNVLAGLFHDHLLVPVGKVEEAIRCLQSIPRSPTSG